MKRVYNAWAVRCADLGNAGFLADHADDGTGDKIPVLFRRRSEAVEYIKTIEGGETFYSVERVRITTETMAP